MQGRRRAAAATLAAAIALAATACGTTEDPGKGAGGSATASVPPRPAGTGPLTKDVVRADIDGVASDAGAPPGAPEWNDLGAADPAGCVVSYKGFSRAGTPADLPRYEALTKALRERAWRFSHKGPGHEEKQGMVKHAQQIFTQRGWTLMAEYNAGAVEGQGQISVMAFDKACADKAGIGRNPVG